MVKFTRSINKAGLLKIANKIMENSDHFGYLGAVILMTEDAYKKNLRGQTEKWETK